MVCIVHFSDWHGQLNNLSEADIYVVTGDILDNYPNFKRTPILDGWPPDPFALGGVQREIVPEKEARLQNEWFRRKFTEKGRLLGLRYFFPKNCKHNPVVVVRGNHDFVDLGPMFGGEYFEVSDDSTRSVEYCGLKFGGFRGVDRFNNEWWGERDPQRIGKDIEMMPDDLDVVVSHAPPHGILDMGYGEHIGSHEFTRWINERLYDEDKKMPRLFCFGHAHDGRGRLETDDGTVFSNAACGKHIIELD